MALDLTPRRLREEIEAALKLRRDTTSRSQSLIRQYADGSRESWTTPEPTFENHCFEWAVNIVPNLVFTNPSVRVTDMGIQDQQTEAVQMGIRSLITQTRLNYELTAVAYDLQFDFGCGLILTEPTPGFMGGGEFTPMRPRFRRLSPRQFFRDARAPEIGIPRFEGHVLVKDIEEMRTETTIDENGQTVLKYDPAALEAITTDDGLDELRRDLMQDQIFLPAKGERGQVVMFECYVPGYNGTGVWVTLGFGGGGDASFLRSEGEREYRGPTGGPYIMYGTYLIPDQVYPLAPLAVTRKQVEEINKHRWQASRDAATAKQIGVVNGAAPGVVANIQDARSGDILSLPGFTGVLNTLKFGGMMPETAEYVEFSSAKLDRLSGLNEVIRGNITGSATATEISQASNYADIRIKYAVSRFREDTALMLGKLADVLYNNSSVAFPITTEDVDGDGSAQRGTFYGGQVEPDPQYPWKPAMTCEIEPYSMEFVNQTKLRQEMVEFQTQVLSIMQQQLAMGPALNGRAMLNDLGGTMNISRSADRYANWQLLYQQMAAQMAMQNAQSSMAMEQQGKEADAPPHGAKGSA